MKMQEAFTNKLVSLEVNSACSDLLYDKTGESDSNESDSTDGDIDEREVIRPRYRPSLPNRSKSAPLPSDDDDSSEGWLIA
jgi:hypothetical protein